MVCNWSKYFGFAADELGCFVIINMGGILLVFVDDGAMVCVIDANQGQYEATSAFYNRSFINIFFW